MPTYPLRLRGFTTWNSAHGREAEFKTFIVRSAEEFAFEVTYQRIEYWGTFRKDAQGMFVGNYSAKDGHATWGDRAYCTLIASSDEYTLDGTWYEQGEKFVWHAELEPIVRIGSAV